MYSSWYWLVSGKVREVWKIPFGMSGLGLRIFSDVAVNAVLIRFKPRVIFDLLSRDAL